MPATEGRARPRHALTYQQTILMWIRLVSDAAAERIDPRDPRVTEAATLAGSFILNENMPPWEAAGLAADLAFKPRGRVPPRTRARL
jgi:hypothetical protein